MNKLDMTITPEEHAAAEDLVQLGVNIRFVAPVAAYDTIAGALRFVLKGGNLNVPWKDANE